MTDVELLFAVLAVIYFWECACWMPRGTVAFRNFAGKKWFLAQPGAWVGNQRGGFVLANPVPPLGRIVTASQFPVSLSGDAALAFVSAAVNPSSPAIQTGKLFEAGQIKSARAKGKKVLLNGELFVKAATGTYAAWIAERIDKWRQAAPEHRPAIGDAIARSMFDTKAIERRWAEFEKQATTLRWLTNALFCYLFIFAPVLIWKVGFHSSWLPLLLGLLVLTISSAFCFRRIHRKLFPAAEDERFTHFLTIMLSPATTPRAQDVLTRPLMEVFHPLAVARIFCDEKAFHEYARRVLIETRYPAPQTWPRDNETTRRVEGHWRAVLLKETERFLKENGVDLKRLCGPPVQSEPGSLSWCPRCEAQFTTRTGTCADCGNLELVAFSKAAKE